LGALKRQGVKNFFIFFTMKKIEIKGKLSLNKSTIANLDNTEMNAVKGGVGDIQSRWKAVCRPLGLSGDFWCC
jgi:natural product precursor